MTKLTGVEKRMMTVNIVTAIRKDDFKIDQDVFGEYARATYPDITNVGVLNLWLLYTLDRTI